MEQVRKYKTRREEAFDGLPTETTITVWRDCEGKFIPSSDDLGMGHRYDSPSQAASDLARRHGYGTTWRIES